MSRLVLNLRSVHASGVDHDIGHPMHRRSGTGRSLTAQNVSRIDHLMGALGHESMGNAVLLAANIMKEAYAYRTRRPNATDG